MEKQEIQPSVVSDRPSLLTGVVACLFHEFFFFFGQGKTPGYTPERASTLLSDRFVCVLFKGGSLPTNAGHKKWTNKEHQEVAMESKMERAVGRRGRRQGVCLYK